MAGFLFGPQFGLVIIVYYSYWIIAIALFFALLYENPADTQDAVYFMLPATT